jgi:hypothetical protein
MAVKLRKKSVPAPKKVGGPEPKKAGGPEPKVGILTLAKDETTKPFKAFHKGMKDNGYQPNDYETVFSPAVDDGDLERAATEMLKKNVDVVLADGNKALQIVNYKDPNMKIVQAVGGEEPADQPNLAGFHLDVHQMCRDQIDDLLATTPRPSIITVLVNNALNPILLATVFPYAAWRGALAIPLVASTEADLNATKFDAVVGSFMIVPNGMFFNHAKEIADLMDGKDVPKIYPEREYYDEHGNKHRVGVRGHKIVEAFYYSAEDVVAFLATGARKRRAKEADKIRIPI